MKFNSSIIFALTLAALAAAPLVRAQSPTASPAGTQARTSGDKAAVEAKIKELGNLWGKAIMQKEPTLLDPIIAEDFVGTNSKGKVGTKNEMYTEMKGDTDTYTSAADADVKVHVFSDDVAVATGSSTEKGKGKEGKEFTRRFRWTDTWMQRGGKWQVVASQSTLVSGDDDDKD